MRNTRAWAADTAGQARIKQLYEHEEAGGGEAPEAAPKSERMLEIEEMMRDTDSVYWHDEAVQNEYRALLESDARGLPAEMTEPENVAAWSDHLQVEPEQVLDMMQRAEQITAEVGDTSELETSFAGLPDTVQHAARLALAEPERRIELLQSLTDSEHEQLAQFLAGMTEEDHKAVERALGLS